jgi:hypothetical protein
VQKGAQLQNVARGTNALNTLVLLKLVLTAIALLTACFTCKPTSMQLSEGAVQAYHIHACRGPCTGTLG